MDGLYWYKGYYKQVVNMMSMSIRVIIFVMFTLFLLRYYGGS